MQYDPSTQNLRHRRTHQDTRVPVSKSAPIIDPRVPGPTKGKAKSRNADLYAKKYRLDVEMCSGAQSSLSPSTHARMNDVSTLARYLLARRACAVAARPRFFLPQNYFTPYFI